MYHAISFVSDLFVINLISWFVQIHWRMVGHQLFNICMFFSVHTFHFLQPNHCLLKEKWLYICRPFQSLKATYKFDYIDRLGLFTLFISQLLFILSHSVVFLDWLVLKTQPLIGKGWKGHYVQENWGYLLSSDIHSYELIHFLPEMFTEQQFFHFGYSQWTSKPQYHV